VVIGLIIGLGITGDQQRPEQTGGRRCETIRTGETDNSREKMQNVRGDSSGVFHEDPKIVGKTLTVDGEVRTVVGVIPPWFQAYGTQTEIWMPISRSRDTPRVEGEDWAEALARLKPGVTIEAASADLDVIGQASGAFASG
jgi:hypothetical protein